MKTSNEIAKYMNEGLFAKAKAGVKGRVTFGTRRKTHYRYIMRNAPAFVKSYFGTIDEGSQPEGGLIGESWASITGKDVDMNRVEHVFKWFHANGFYVSTVAYAIDGDEVALYVNKSKTGKSNCDSVLVDALKSVGKNKKGEYNEDNWFSKPNWNVYMPTYLCRYGNKKTSKKESAEAKYLRKVITSDKKSVAGKKEAEYLKKFVMPKTDAKKVVAPKKVAPIAPKKEVAPKKVVDVNAMTPEELNAYIDAVIAGEIA